VRNSPLREAPVWFGFRAITEREGLVLSVFDFAILMIVILAVPLIIRAGR
jgi:hypothetical protein